MFYSAQYLVPHLVSVLAALALVVVALRVPRVARFLFLLLFGWACVVNFSTALRTPAVYLEYAPLAVSNVYREIILGPFARHIPLFVGIVATCQGCIALGVALGDSLARIALGGAIVFLVDIAPLGVGSGFPSTLFMAAAAGILLGVRRRPVLDGPVWRLNRTAPRAHDDVHAPAAPGT